MAIERKEPTLSSNPAPTTGNKPKTQNVRPPQPKVIVQKASSGFLWFTFLITLLVAAGAGYTFWQFLQSQQMIATQQVRIDELEKKLLLTGDESTQSLTALTANLKGLDKDVKLVLSEVDKLWGTRNVNLKAIEKLDKDSESTVAKTKENAKSIAAMETKLSKPVASLEQRTGEQELLIQSLRERIGEQNKQIQSLQGQVKQFASASKQVDSVSKKVDGYDETIRSFDKFRITTNRDLLLLKERAGILSAPPK